MIRIEVNEAAFDAGHELAALERTGAGGVASFIGVVRGDGGLIELFLEHHPAMTKPALEALATAAVARWQLDGVTLIHRVGPLAPADPIVFVGTAARHRGAALEACAALIDRLKTEAPFWKRERFADGRTTWVDPRTDDDVAAERWR